MGAEPWVCPWGSCNAEQAQQCRAETGPRKGCGGMFPGMTAEQARREVQPRGKQLTEDDVRRIVREELERNTPNAVVSRAGHEDKP